ncbi:MAG: pyrroline-5-carboxylate reductase [Pseudomonadota bacterium]
MKLAFIGGGNMAAALIGGLIKQGFAAGAIEVAEISPERCAWLKQQFGVSASEHIADLRAADVIVLAVKPQQMREVLRGLPTPRLTQLVLSIAAGIRAKDISRWLGGHPAVVRAMPNTPALVGAGIAGLYALPDVSQAQRAAAQRVMEAVGTAVWVDTEAQIDAVTAISGSGPAYVFYFIEALEQAAVELGLPPLTARRLVLHTFNGAARLAMSENVSPAELRARVTSKGGTTEQGLLVLEQAAVRQAIMRAAEAAAKRGHEIGELFGEAH